MAVPGVAPTVPITHPHACTAVLYPFALFLLTNDVVGYGYWVSNLL